MVEMVLITSTSYFALVCFPNERELDELTSELRRHDSAGIPPHTKFGTSISQNTVDGSPLQIASGFKTRRHTKNVNRHATSGGNSVEEENSGLKSFKNQTEQPRNGLFHLFPMDDVVDKSMLEQEFRPLKSLWQFLPNRLADDTRPRKANERTRFR